jgi:response regulator NasT
VVGVCHSGGNAIRLASIKRCDIVLCSSNLPDMTGLNMALDILSRCDVSVVLITSSDEKMHIENNYDGYDITCLVKPVTKAILQNSLEIAMNYRYKLYGMKKERDRLQKTLARKAVVAKAKGIIMERYNMSEPDAYRMIQKTSMDTGIPVKEIAKTIIETNGKDFYRY